MDRRGFTLIELLVTISVIGILAGVAVTAYVGSIKKAERSEAFSNLEALRLLEEQFFADNGIYTTDLGTYPGGTAAIAVQNIIDIQTALPRFQPGPSTNYAYAIQQDMEINSNAGNTTSNPPTYQGATPCFVATATGIDDTRVEDDLFVIDCNNNRNF